MDVKKFVFVQFDSKDVVETLEPDKIDQAELAENAIKLANILEGIAPEADVDNPQVINEENAGEEVFEEKPELKLTQEELDKKLEAALKEGYNTGYQDAKNEYNDLVQESIQQQQLLYANIYEKISDMNIDSKTLLKDQVCKNLSNFAIAIAEKTSGQILDKKHNEIIFNIINDTIQNIVEHDELKIEVNSKNIDLIKYTLYEKIKDIEKMKVEIVANDEISVYDCNIKWESGLLKFNYEERKQELTNLINNYLENVSEH